MPKLIEEVLEDQQAAPQAQPSATPAPAALNSKAFASMIGNQAMMRMLSENPRLHSPADTGARAGFNTLAREAGFNLAPLPMLHRTTCACGGTILGGGECASCKARRESQAAAPAPRSAAVAQPTGVRPPLQPAVSATPAGAGSGLQRKPARSLQRDPITLPEVQIEGDPNAPPDPITIPDVVITGDANKGKNDACKKKVDTDTQACLDEANTACSIMGAGIAGIGAIGGGMVAGPVGAGIGAVAGGVIGAWRYGECVKDVGNECRKSTDEEKEKCDDQFPLSGD